MRKNADYELSLNLDEKDAKEGHDGEDRRPRRQFHSEESQGDRRNTEAVTGDDRRPEAGRQKQPHNIGGHLNGSLLQTPYCSGIIGGPAGRAP